MKIIRAKDYNDMSRKAANIISAQVILQPDSVLGLATGSSPIGIYEQLIKWYNKGDVDFGECTTFNLDEYRGLTAYHDQSYHYFMHKNFFDAVNIPESRINLPDGAQMDAERECARYDAAIKAAGGIDLQLLGMGVNGHIGFNEPDDCFSKGTHCVDLTESTIGRTNASLNLRTTYRVRPILWACRPSCSRAALSLWFRAKTRRTRSARRSSAR